MTAADGDAELLPLRTDFDVVWRGFDPGQVRRHVAATEADLRALAVDRDEAVARAEDLTRQLENARAEIHVLRQQLDRVCRTPVDPQALDYRLRRMAELAHEQAAEITARAKAAAEHHWASAERASTRLRERYDRLVGELDERRRELEAEHREVMRQAHDRVHAMTRQAELRRRELDEQAAELREQVQADFELAMNARRAEAAADLAARRAAAEAEAARLVREAEARAAGIVAEAQRRVDELRGRRDRIAEGLRTARELLAEAEPLLDPLPEEVLPEEVLVEEVLVEERSTDGVPAGGALPDVVTALPTQRSELELAS
ncbi:coiled-coil domain-containing protein [Saccharothrix syringae]|uniref:Cellulose-binding protein n=1 Tax=Saccharothrix syringae TaxID=103733 RepID=A0A5Q0GU27_SACSY|nr:hypothetical protein [Saccharothrix syringae]QFZ17431.1 cellulose-binding protein [Saccharothrix syringae]